MRKNKRARACTLTTSKQQRFISWRIWPGVFFCRFYVELSMGLFSVSAIWEDGGEVSHYDMGWRWECTFASLCAILSARPWVLCLVRAPGRWVREHIHQSTFNRMWLREATSPKSHTAGLLATLTFGFIGLRVFLNGEDSWCCKDTPPPQKSLAPC